MRTTTPPAPTRERRRAASPVPPAPRSARTRSRLREADAQHRLSRIQVHNWGTFNGYHDLPVPRDGLLLTGPSGSGKSSLLDALSAVLVPAKNRRFNAAAQDSGSTDRARTILSYVRGAYRRTTDGATGEVVTDFLRAGATRSGVALTFSQGGEAAESLTLIVLFHVRAATNASDAVAQLLLMADGSPDLTSLLPYLAHGIDRRAIRRDHPEGLRLFDKYEAFATAFRRRLGLSSEVAQRLLHRTQAAKSLTSLDALLRDFMLDEPETLRLADAAVEQFGELRQAHAAVVEAREQEKVLAPLPELSRTIIDAGAQQAHAEALAAAVPGYVHHLRLARLEEERDRAAAAVTGLEAEVAQAAAREDSAVADLDLLRAERHGAAGTELPAATARLEAAQAEAARRADAVRALERCLSELDATAPADARAHYELQAVLAAEDSCLRGQLASLRAERDTAGLAALDLKRRIDALTTEREQILASRSAMPSRLLGARDLIATVIGQPASVLPFAGEILRVVDGEEDWRVAIEAVAGKLRHPHARPRPPLPGRARRRRHPPPGRPPPLRPPPARRSGRPRHPPRPRRRPGPQDRAHPRHRSRRLAQRRAHAALRPPVRRGRRGARRRRPRRHPRRPGQVVAHRLPQGRPPRPGRPPRLGDRCRRPREARRSSSMSSPPAPGRRPRPTPASTAWRPARPSCAIGSPPASAPRSSPGSRSMSPPRPPRPSSGRGAASRRGPPSRAWPSSTPASRPPAGRSPGPARPCAGSAPP
ncbi:ATP-binding protein [Actinomyces timonensis]|uniref:ATP-binding protein n=1 Tax=Actinomyces timonensis TaxID=1288391 RepID=A0AAU8N155_9ACTO